ncbi:MAG: malate synthase A [Robiginitomaculum sp.]|nr:MAG: malate synthase A [Robiginitomaculum sp.]
MTGIGQGIEVNGALKPGFDEILSPDALAFIADLHRRFNPARQRLLAARTTRQKALDAGQDPDFDPMSADIRAGDWRIRPVPTDLQDRRVEITGPVDRKMIINALNCGAKCFMADFEDASSPVWENMVQGQINLRDANARKIDFEDTVRGKSYALKDNPAVLIVRPRGWHLDEAHMLIDGEAMSASLFDFGLYLFHNHETLKNVNSGPYYYLPKLENAAEARLWNMVILHAQAALGLPVGTVRVTVLIETILASFQIDEILYALRDHIVGLNCGRWDYIFSYIKRFAKRAERTLPDRAEVTMTSPFMRAYSRLVIETCHKRGAHAIGGMAAQIPVKGDNAANDAAFAKVRADKEREVTDGHDGTWVAHPGMVALATEVFDEYMPAPNQVGRLNGYSTSAADLLTPSAGAITLGGVRTNIEVGILYIASWLRGQGAAPIHNLMEDAATAEISRAQLWQWRVHSAKMDDGHPVDTALLEAQFDDILAQMRAACDEAQWVTSRNDEAVDVMRALVFDDNFAEFLTLPAYELIK